MSIVSDRISILRRTKRMTLEHVASYIGVTKSTVQKYESGSVDNIPLNKISALAELFNVSPAYLCGWTDSETEEVLDALEEEIQRMYRSLTNKQKIIIYDTVKELYTNWKVEK